VLTPRASKELSSRAPWQNINKGERHGAQLAIRA
jgi:hypothetical protein